MASKILFVPIILGVTYISLLLYEIETIFNRTDDALLDAFNKTTAFYINKDTSYFKTPIEASNFLDKKLDEANEIRRKSKNLIPWFLE